MAPLLAQQDDEDDGGQRLICIALKLPSPAVAAAAACLELLSSSGLVTTAEWACCDELELDRVAMVVVVVLVL